MNEFQNMNLNERFIQMLDDPEMEKKAQEKSNEYLKAQVYEDSFMEKILPSQPINQQQVDRAVEAPNFQVVLDKEYKDVAAIQTGLRGLSDYQYVEEDRYAVRFWKIQSEEQEKEITEIKAMRQPIQRLIRHQAAFRIRKQMDKAFIGMVNDAISQNPADQVVETDEAQITPELLVDLKNILDGLYPEYMEATTLLMTKAQYNNIDTWIQSNTTAGSNTGVGADGGIEEDYWRDGYSHDQLFGCRVIKTRKADLIDHDEVYVFPDPDYLGHHFTFNDDTFSIVKHHDRISYKGWRTAGFAIGNSYACGKLKLNVNTPSDPNTI